MIETLNLVVRGCQGMYLVIHCLYLLSLTITPGWSRSPHPMPQLTTPARCQAVSPGPPGERHSQWPARVPVTAVATALGVPGAHEDVRDVLGVARPPVQRLAAGVGQHGDLQLAEDGGQGAGWTCDAPPRDPGPGPGQQVLLGTLQGNIIP